MTDKNAQALKALKDAIEGECDGLAITDDQARSILAHVDSAAPSAAEPVAMALREAFEARIKQNCGDLTTFGHGEHMHYRNSAVNNAWCGWKDCFGYMLANDRAELAHAQAYLRQAQELLTGNEATLHAENQRLRALLAAPSPEAETSAEKPAVEELDCVREALPEEWRTSVPSVAVSTLVAELVLLRSAAAQADAPVAEPVVFDEWRRALAEMVDAYIQLQADNDDDEGLSEAYGKLLAHIRTTPFEAPPAPEDGKDAARKPLTEVEAIKLWHQNTVAHSRNSAFEWFAAGVIAAERVHGITDAAMPDVGREGK